MSRRRRDTNARHRPSDRGIKSVLAGKRDVSCKEGAEAVAQFHVTDEAYFLTPVSTYQEDRMGQYFRNSAIGPFREGDFNTIERGYDAIAHNARESVNECQAQLALIEDRIQTREINRIYDGPNDLDPEYQDRLDTYYRCEANKLRWLIRGYEAIADLASQPARDPNASPFKVVSIR